MELFKYKVNISIRNIHLKFYKLGFISDKLAGSTIDVNASKGTIELNVRDWFSTLKLDQHVDQ
jgi:hypothetical protein